MSFVYKPDHAIDHQPVTGLAECLSLSPKLESIALLYDLVDPDAPEEAPAREELIARLCEEIPARFARDIPYFSEEEAAFVALLTEDADARNPLLEDRAAAGYYNLNAKGYCFIFDWADQLRPVVPRELWPVWAGAMADEAVLSAQKHNRELLRYADALANLYGAYEVEQFAAVWNQHHRDKLTPEEAEAALLQIQQFDGSFWLEDGLVVSDSIMDDEELDELLEAAEGIPYYMPTKSVIALYADDSHYDEDRPELNKLKKFLTELEPEDAFRWFDLDFEIVMSCEESWDGEQLVELLAGHGFPFGDNAAFEEFARLYRALRDNTRQWVLRGHTPADYAREFGGARPDFRMPLPAAKGSKKVGRNEPCPCGSGKKYKKCCGR